MAVMARGGGVSVDGLGRELRASSSESESASAHDERLLKADIWWRGRLALEVGLEGERRVNKEAMMNFGNE